MCENSHISRFAASGREHAEPDIEPIMKDVNSRIGLEPPSFLRAISRAVRRAWPQSRRLAASSSAEVVDRLTLDPAQRELLISSGLFDWRFYAQQAGLVDAEIEQCVEHYLAHGAAAGHSPNRLFDRDAYLAHHVDVAAAKVDPFVHFVTCGISEGRRNTVPDACLTQINSMTFAALAERRILDQASAMGWSANLPSAWTGAPVAVYASSLGNFFFRHIADRIAEGLRTSGVTVSRLDQNSARPPETAVDFFVAPHEFFHLGGGRGWRGRPEVARAVMFNTEQPGTPWYFLALSYAGPAATVVDLSPQSALLLHDLRRWRSGYLPLGWLPRRRGSPANNGRSSLTDVRGLEVLAALECEWSQDRVDPWRERPIDVLFLGTLTPRRSKALARLAATLAKYRCFIHAPTGAGRPLTGGKTEIGVDHSLWLARNAKVMLNLHRDEFPYLEWHRVMMMGIEQGALVVSEPCLPSPGIEPGRHFLAAALDEMPEVLDRLLGSSDGEQFSAAVDELATNELPQRFDLRVELRALAFLHSVGFPQHA
jgi:hypothetical protein